MKLEDTSFGGAREVIADMMLPVFDVYNIDVCFHFKAKVSVSQEESWVLNGVYDSDNFHNSILLFRSEWTSSNIYAVLFQAGWNKKHTTETRRLSVANICEKTFILIFAKLY